MTLLDLIQIAKYKLIALVNGEQVAQKPSLLISRGRNIFGPEHEIFRKSFRSFIEKQVVPHYEDFESKGAVSRDVWTAAGDAGFIGLDIDEEYGGGGGSDFRFNAIIGEEVARAGTPGFAISLHNDVISPYLNLMTDEQMTRYLPSFCRGQLIVAIAMTEPEAGSDLKGIRSSAVQDNGGDFILNGRKTFITNGLSCDLVIVAAQCQTAAGPGGISLFLVDRGTPGFEVGHRLKKIGQHAQDTAELSFDNVCIPSNNLLGNLGEGFGYLMANLAQERLSIAVNAVASAEAILEITAEYCAQRTAFGQPIGSFQHSRFTFADLVTAVHVQRVFIDQCLQDHLSGALSPVTAAMAKLSATETQKHVIDRCLQLHGGYGYMREYAVARAYMDSRVQTIYGGTSEIMKEIIGRALGFGEKRASAR